MSKTSLLSYCMVFMLALGLNAQAQEDEGDRLDKVREKGVLRVAVYRDFPPYSYLEKGRYRGIDVELAQALAERMGVGVDLMPLTADESVGDDLRNAIWKGHYLGGGVADLMMHVPVDREFAAENRRVAIFAPYLSERVAVAIDAGQVAGGTEFMEFYRHKIGVELDTIADHYLSAAYGGRFRASLVRFLNVGEALSALRAGRVAVVAAPRPQLEYGLADAAPGSYRINALPMQGLFRGEWAVGLAVAAGNPRLNAALEEAMKQVQADGTLRRIMQSYRLGRDQLAHR